MKAAASGLSITFVAILGIFLAAIGCQNLIDSNALIGSSNSLSAQSGTRTPKWVATTGHIADALRHITKGTGVEITQLCGPGVDPHSYSASTGDVQSLANADAIFFNGFHLEAKLHDLLEEQFVSKSWSMASAFPDTARLEWLEDGQVDPSAPFDPHIWNHLPGWATCVEALTEHLCQIDAENAAVYRENGKAYVEEIRAAHEQATARFEKLPEESRVLVSAHDAFQYFAKVYDFEPVSVLGIGNDAEADIRTMREVAETICERKVPVIFLENITNPKVTLALQEACEARNWSVEIADTPLYSDDLGVEAPLDTFLGAFSHNVALISKSLQR